LKTAAPAIGCLEEATFGSAIQSVPPGARLLVLSDGVYEIFQPDNRVGTWEEFVNSLEQPDIRALGPHDRYLWAQRIRGAERLEDDFSLIQVRFP